MIITVDIGNTNITVAGFDDGLEPSFVESYPDNRFYTAEELYDALKLLCEAPEAAVLCCVVPSLGEMAKTALMKLTNGNVLIIDSSFDDGLVLTGYDRKKLGNDRVADMTAVKKLYGLPAVIFDMGTATTVSVIDREGAFIGGMIMPGLGLSLNALSSGTALLPGINPYPPTCLLGQDTVSCINNGVLYSQASAIDGICDRVEEALGEGVNAVVTGGAARFVLPLCRRRTVYDRYLLLKGLKILYENK